MSALSKKTDTPGFKRSAAPRALEYSSIKFQIYLKNALINVRREPFQFMRRQLDSARLNVARRGDQVSQVGG